MLKRILALIWLRTQVLLNNKNTLVQVIFPFFLVLLFQNFMNTDGTQGKTLLYSSLTMAFSFSSGSMISSSIAEEKEKRIFKTLILSGVRRGEYLVSVLFYPVIFASAAIIAFPIMVEFYFGTDYPIYLAVVSLVALCTILLNLVIGSISETQTQAQVYGLIPMLALSFLPMFSQVSSEIKNFIDTTFLGVYVDFFNKADFKLNFDSLIVSLLWIVGLFGLSYWALKNTKRPKFRKWPIDKLQKLTCPKAWEVK